jgi:hypothetical protein
MGGRPPHPLRPEQRAGGNGRAFLFTRARCGEITPIPTLPHQGEGLWSPIVRITRLGLRAYVLAVLVLVLDQLSKWWILDVFRLPERGSVEILPIFSLSMVWNRGVSFGLFQAEDAGRWILAAFSLAVVASRWRLGPQGDRPMLAPRWGS